MGVGTQLCIQVLCYYFMMMVPCPHIPLYIIVIVFRVIIQWPTLEHNQSISITHIKFTTGYDFRSGHFVHRSTYNAYPLIPIIIN